MKAGWEVKALGEVCTLQRGFDLPTTQRTAGIYPLVTSSGPTDTHSEYKVEGPGVVTGRSGSIGNVYFVKDHFWPLNTALYVKDFHGNDPKFVWYLLQYFDLSRFSTGAGVPTLNRNDVHGEAVNAPNSTAEQKRIVEVLDAAFEGLSRARAHTETNLQNARELFESYRDELFGNPNNGWAEAPLSEYIANITYGFTNPMPDAETGPLKITAKNVNNGKIDYDGARSTTQVAFDTLLTEKSRPKIGDVLLTKDGTLGRTAVVDVEGLCVNQSVAVITPKPGILPIFLHELLSCRINQTAMIADAGGTTIKHLYITRVPNIPVFVPDVEAQSRTLETLALFQSEARSLISHYRAKLADLDALRQALLQKAFAGELT